MFLAQTGELNLETKENTSRIKKGRSSTDLSLEPEMTDSSPSVRSKTMCGTFDKGIGRCTSDSGTRLQFFVLKDA